MPANNKYKLAFLISHPTQYHAPLFRELAKSPQIDLTVYYCSKIGLGKKYDKTYERVLKWDTPVLEGYRYIFFKKLQIFRELKKNKYDAIIVHGYNLFVHWFAFLVAWLTKTPLILKGEADIEKKPNFPKNIIKKVILNSLFKQAGAFLYSYKANREFFKFYGAPEEKLFFCPSAVDNDFWRSRRKKLQTKKPLLLYVGQFIPRKRLIDILEAAKILKGKIDFEILFVGEGKEKDNLIKFVSENRLSNVSFTGFKNQTELPEIYSAASIFVLPSEYDPSPKAMQEALNFELPIIVSDGVKTAPDLILNGGCGFVYEAGNIRQLTNNIEKLITDDKLRSKLGKNALDVASKWSPEENVKGIMSAVRYVINGRK